MVGRAELQVKLYWFQFENCVVATKLRARRGFRCGSLQFVAVTTVEPRLPINPRRARPAHELTESDLRNAPVNCAKRRTLFFTNLR